MDGQLGTRDGSSFPHKIAVHLTKHIYTYIVFVTGEDEYSRYNYRRYNPDGHYFINVWHHHHTMFKKSFSNSQYEKNGHFPATKLLQREPYHAPPAIT